MMFARRLQRKRQNGRYPRAKLAGFGEPERVSSSKSRSIAPGKVRRFQNLGDPQSCWRSKAG